MNRMDQFIGGGFTWFTGVVEDRFDPLEMNRVKSDVLVSIQRIKVL